MCENAIKLCILLGYKSFQLFHSTIKREFLKSFTKKICYKMKSFFLIIQWLLVPVHAPIFSFSYIHRRDVYISIECVVVIFCLTQNRTELKPSTGFSFAINFADT